MEAACFRLNNYQGKHKQNINQPAKSLHKY